MSLMFLLPGTSLLLTATFLLLWNQHRHERHLLLIGGAYLLFSLAALVQILFIPRDIGINAMVGGLLYTLAGILLLEGCFQRVGRVPDRMANAAIAIAIMAGLGWFYYIERDVIARILIQNFGYGVLLLVGALRLGPTGKGKGVDRLLFWVLIAFALHFFPRTLLSIERVALTRGPEAFGVSLFWTAVVFTLTLFSLALALTLLAAAISDHMDRIRQERDEDSLTRLLNRRAFEREAAAALEGPGDRPFSLILCDIDHFKRINDNWGHPAGDIVIRAFARLVAQAIGADDRAGRIGGEEFALLLRDQDIGAARRLAEKLRLRFGDMAFDFDGGQVRATASFGIAGHRPGESMSALIARADALLYAAKREGRNRVVAERRAGNVHYLDTVRSRAEPADGRWHGM